MIPSARLALTDRRLRGAPREIYFWLHERLDVVAFRPMTIGRISIGTGLRRNTVHRALLTLLDAGYLARQESAPRSFGYRLTHSPPMML